MMARVPSGCVPIATEIGSVNVTLGISTSLKLWTNSAGWKDVERTGIRWPQSPRAQQTTQH